MFSSDLPEATCRQRIDVQGRRFEQLVGENPVPWSRVYLYGLERRLEVEVVPMLAMLPRWTE